MHVLLTGGSGYIGIRLLFLLIQKGHTVIALVRNPKRLQLPEEFHKKTEVLQADLLDPKTLENLPKDIDAAYYLVHAMSNNPELFSEMDRMSAQNFNAAMQKTHCQQIIYLSGLAKDVRLSKHLSSRIEVGNILKQGSIPVTILQTSIIIGAGSASFEIIRDLVEKLPLMITPLWVRKKCQPISIVDVLEYLMGVLGNTACYGKVFEIGGPEKISYQDMLLRYAKKRKLKRFILPVPVLTPRLSSYWLLFITNTNFYLARSLIDSLKNDSIQTDFSIQTFLPKTCLTYEEAIELALQKIKQNAFISSWRHPFIASKSTQYIETPQYGCLFKTWVFSSLKEPKKIMESIRSLKEKKNDWQLLLVEERRSLLYAEKRFSGETWLELQIQPKRNTFQCIQTITFRPRGVLGRLYWYIFYPIHIWIFHNLGKLLAG